MILLKCEKRKNEKNKKQKGEGRVVSGYCGRKKKKNEMKNEMFRSTKKILFHFSFMYERRQQGSKQRSKHVFRGIIIYLSIRELIQQ